MNEELRALGIKLVNITSSLDEKKDLLEEVVRSIEHLEETLDKILLDITMIYVKNK